MKLDCQYFSLRVACLVCCFCGGRVVLGFWGIVRLCLQVAVYMLLGTWNGDVYQIGHEKR
ncbi:hypothetical protein BJX99DRAFT_153409 [Aspergillus californicus]